jgi:voltage-gated potassium channel
MSRADVDESGRTGPELKASGAFQRSNGRGEASAPRFSAARFLIAIILWIITTPFIDSIEHGYFIESLLLTLLLLSAVLVFETNRTKLIQAIILVAPAFAAKWINLFWPDAIPISVYRAFALLFVAFVVVHIFRFVLAAPRVNREVLCAAVSNYFMMGILWMFAYLLVASLLPNSFAFNAGPPSERSIDGFTALYFSFVTLSTIGFGDITPISIFARMLAVSEASTGIIYMTVVIARLVALYSSEGKHEHSDGQKESGTENNP